MFVILSIICSLCLIQVSQSANVTRAAVTLEPTTGSTAEGFLYFEQVSGKILIRGNVSGLIPLTVHGLHVHEYGFIGINDGTGTGGHYNPNGVPHACFPAPRHVGDLGNIDADEEGYAEVEMVFSTTEISLNGANSVLGRGVIVHSDEDDCKTQPTGNAGKRLAQGVIGVAPDLTDWFY